jgi:UDP-2-acetamido-3-amino-2,3-dideoxy-glucuronate N-acetyltransferase
MLLRDVALVGAGYWGRNLARNFNALAALHTLCDRSTEILDGYGADYVAVRKTDSFESVLADGAVTKVVVATPAGTHFRLARAALLAGKDVFVEKPLCLDIAEAEELVATAERVNRLLMVGHLLQYHPCIIEIRRLLAAGDLGRIQYLISNRLNLGKIRQEENALWSFAPHDISVILSLVGGDLPDQVRCTGESYLTPDVADTTLTTLRFPGKIRAHMHVSWLNPFKEQKLTVVGSRGMVVFDDTKPWGEKLVLHRDYLNWSDGRVPTPSRAEGVRISVKEDEPLRQECMHFLDCCRSRVTPRTDGREGLRVLRVLKAAQSSLEHEGEARTTVPDSRGFSAHPTAIIAGDAKVGAGTKVWHFTHIMSGASVGENCNLGQNVVVSSGVTLGRNVKVQNNVSIYTGAVIEDDVFLGPSCVLTNVTNPRSQINRRGAYERTLIRKGASIGANATIVCGIEVGRYAFVSAGAVVTKSVPDYALVVGNPARVRSWMSRHGQRLRAPDGDGVYRCPESGLRYKEIEQGRLACLDLDENAPLPEDLARPGMPYRRA